MTSPQARDRKTMTAKEVAAALDKNYDTVLRWCRSGALPAWQPEPRGEWVVPRSAVDRILSGSPPIPVDGPNLT